MATDADSFVLRPGDPLSPVVYGIGIKSRSRAAAARSVRPVSPPPRAAVAAKKPSDEFAISSGSETEDDDSLKRAQNPAAESAPKRQGSFILQKFPNKCQALTPGDGGGGGGDPILAAALAKKRRIEVTPLPSIFGRKEKDKEKTKPRRGDEPKISKKKKKKKFSEKYKDLIPPNRKYVAQARAADDISQMPAQPAAIDACGMDPDDPDSKVPEPEACRGRYLVAYSQCIYKPGVPPHPQFDRFDTYEDWVLALLYRSILWGDEHNKFLVASLASSALGQNPNKTPEKAWQECRYPSALRNENEYSLYILERGVQIEPLHEHLFRVVGLKVL